MVDGSSFSFQVPLELFGIPRKSYVLLEDVIDFCNMQKVKTLSMVAYIMDHWSLVVIDPYDDVVYHLDSLKTSSRDDIKYIFFMRYMREIMSEDTNIITNVIDRRNSYSRLELDEIRVELAEFLARYI
ncbi:hypothetical protein IC582_028464 [Cucumis melo]